MYVTWKPFQPLVLLADKNSNESGPVENKFIGFGGRESGGRLRPQLSWYYLFFLFQIDARFEYSPDIIFFPFPDRRKTRIFSRGYLFSFSLETQDSNILLILSFFLFWDRSKIHYSRLDPAQSVDKFKMCFGKHFERKATFPPLKLNITIERHFHWQYLLFKVLKTFPFQLNNKSLQKAHCWH